MRFGPRRLLTYQSDRKSLGFFTFSRIILWLHLVFYLTVCPLGRVGILDSTRLRVLESTPIDDGLELRVTILAPSFELFGLIKQRRWRL